MGTIARGIDRLKHAATPRSWPILRHPKIRRINRALNIVEALWDGLVSAGAVVTAIAVEQYFRRRSGNYMVEEKLGRQVGYRACFAA